MNRLMSRHAESRQQQRGIPPIVIDCLMDFGREEHDHRGGSILYFDHRARRQLRRSVGREHFKHIEPHLDAYVVMGCDGTVVTVGHRTHRINHH